jgi:hypothetical protein
VSDFFVGSAYFDSTGRELPCYLLSKMGCEMVANKLIGEKGVLFTAAYVSKFNEMEAADRAELESLLELAKKPEPRLGEINATVRIIVRGMKGIGAEPEQIMRFLKETYTPLGINIDFEADTELDDDFDYDYNTVFTPNWHTAQEIAIKCGFYSMYGKPHSQAASCILNENIFISDEHIRTDAEIYNGFSGSCVRYDSHALIAVMQWLIDNDFPDEIYGFDRTFYIRYREN